MERIKMSILDDIAKKKKKNTVKKKQKSNRPYQYKNPNVWIGKASKSEPTPLFMR